MYSLGIDIRRFVSFGVIKGILRRVHRWPVFRIPTQLSSDIRDPFYDDAETPLGATSPAGSGFALRGGGGGGVDSSGFNRTTHPTNRPADSLSAHSLSLPTSQGRSTGSLRGSQGKTRYRPDEGEASWSAFGYPLGLTVDHLDGDHHSDTLSVEFGIPWAGERGLETALNAFAKVHGGIVEIIYR